MQRHPEMVAGEGRDVTDLMRLLPGAVAKDGFEGVQLAGLADGSAVAVKISDGGDRARMPATVRLLEALGRGHRTARRHRHGTRAGRRPPGGPVAGHRLLEPRLVTKHHVRRPTTKPCEDPHDHHRTAPDATSAPATRSEHDLLGDRDVPADAYWGVHTLRAVENFPITGQQLSSNMHLVRGLAAVKLAGRQDQP